MDSAIPQGGQAAAITDVDRVVVDAEIVDDSAATTRALDLVTEYDIETLRRHNDDLTAQNYGITDPAEIERIRARVAYGQRPWWQRLLVKEPQGWRGR